MTREAPQNPPQALKQALQRRKITPETALMVDASGVPRRVVSTFPRPTWKKRQPADEARHAHPGTALQIGQDIYEIVAIAVDPARRGVTSYDLAPWDESFTIRVIETLDRDSCRAAHQRHLENLRRLRIGRRLRWLAVLTGLLPAEIQNRLQRDYGVPAMRATALSALVLLGGSIFGLILGFAASRGHDFGAWQPFLKGLWTWAPVVALLPAESVVRLTVGVSTRDPLGSFVVAAPFYVVEAFRDAAGKTREAPKISAHTFSQVRDTVAPWNGPEADLEVRSRLPKDHWAVNGTGVVYRGETYLVVDRQKIHEGAERHRFLLQVPRQEVLFRDVREYDPTEVREVYREMRHRDATTWVSSFRILWGLLDEGRQKRLAAAYDYDPRQATRQSLVLVLVVGGLATFQGLGRMYLGGSVLDLLEFFLGVVLLWETAVRWGHYRNGRWRASLLGALVRGRADHFLRWAPPKPSRPRPRPGRTPEPANPQP